MEVKIKKLYNYSKLPTQAYEDAAAWDLYATSIKVVDEVGYGFIEYGLGLAFEIPSGYVAKIYPRSSVSNTGMILANCVGLIDPDYRGEVTARFKWVKGTKLYSVGDKVAQMRIEATIPVIWVDTDDLSDTIRGSGGYGSSDKNNKTD
jgi:dUTP pyrophosphatase